MKKVLLISALFISAALSAQNLNPVVEVTNVYAREATGIEKPSQLLPLPDSVFKFNLDFDYSVQSTPYKGAYEFNPYLVQMRPAARFSDEHKFYLKAGAGYTMHPELELVWNPVRANNFRMNLYASHNSYMGYYRNITEQEQFFDFDGTKRADGGIGSRTTAGADFYYAFKGGQLSADLQYRNILATNFYSRLIGASAPETNIAHRGQGQLRIQNAPGAKFLYNLGTRLAYLGDGNETEFHSVSDITLGVRFGGSSFRVIMGAETVSFPWGDASAMGAKFEAAPHYAFNKGRWNLDLGVKLSYVYRSEEDIYPYKSGFIFPDVNLSFRISDAAVLQASATGGDRIASYDSLQEDNLYLGAFEWHRDVIVTRFNVAGGLRGSIGGRFSYDIKGGYKWVDNAYGWSYYYDPVLVPTMVYVRPLRTAYVEGKLAWNSEHWDIQAVASYGYTPKPDLEDEVAKNVFVPASFHAQGHFFYKWGGRIKVGATIEARSKYRGRVGIPAYQDLGIYAEYAFGRKMALWAKGGNLLNQTIQRTPFYAEGGIYGTAGIKLLF